MTKSRIVKLKLKKLTAYFPLATVMIFLAVPYSTKSVTDALLLCGGRLIPSLFPFMVISDLLIKSDCADMLGKLMKRPLRLLFNLPPSASCAWLLGTVCGFPIGAKLTAKACERGEISRDEASLLLALSSAASPAFVIGAVGRGILQSERVGLFLYLLHIAVGFSVCILLRHILPIKEAVVAPKRSHARNSSGAAESFTSSLQSAALAMLCVSGYVVFFSVLCDYLRLIPIIENNNVLRAIAISFVEMTGGTNAAGELCGSLKLSICGFAVSFSGISVLAQSAAFAAPQGIELGRLIISKLLSGIITAIICLCLPITI